MIKLIEKESELGGILLPFFAQERYLKTKSPVYGWFVSEKFILPFTLFEKFIFKRIVFTTEVITIYNEQTIEDEEKFLNEMIEFTKKNSICDFIYKPQPSAIFRTYPKNSDAFKWGTFQIDINDDFDYMLQRLSSSQRKYVRQAIRDNVKVTITDNYEEVYNFSNNTLLRQKIPLSINKNEFIHQYKNLYPQNMLMFKVSHEDNIQGVLVMFFDHQNAFAEYSGSILKPINGSLKLLHLYAMHYLAKNYNLINFDFVGAVPDIIEDSKEAGIQKFKKEFGAKIKEGYQFTIIINSFKYFIFNLCLKTYFFMKRINYVDPVERNRRLSRSKLKI